MDEISEVKITLFQGTLTACCWPSAKESRWTSAPEASLARPPFALYQPLSCLHYDNGKKCGVDRYEGGGFGLWWSVIRIFLYSEFFHVVRVNVSFEACWYDGGGAETTGGAPGGSGREPESLQLNIVTRVALHLCK